MARNYTVEDVESLRSKGGVSYEEAIRLLDKYDENDCHLKALYHKKVQPAKMLKQLERIMLAHTIKRL